MNTIPNEPTCPKCGKSVSFNAFEGLCPECLIQAGFGTVTNDPGIEKISAFVPPKPEELARYFLDLEIMELLGRGGMGAVYKARQKRLNRLVALKILPPGVGESPSFAQRFEREAQALAQLHHPNIVTLYDSGQVDGLFYFFMEFVDGVNLRQLLDAGHISPKEALAIVPQICDALQFAHDRGIVHRDIKPENILVNKEGQVKIADFGVAKIIARGLSESVAGSAGAPQLGQTEAGKVIGTPQYMAPEQLSHPLDVDNRADIYALGVVFYQMLTGELPAGKFEPPSRKVQIDVRLDEVVLRALEKEPSLRYQQANVMKTQVETIVESGFAGSESPTESEPLAPLLRTAESLYATPEYLATIWGAMKLHESAAVLRLYTDRLEINLKWRNIVIPLRELSRLQVVSYPRFLNFGGMHALEIEFTKAGLPQRLLLTPSLNRSSISKQGVDEWFALLRSTTIAATGQPPAGSATAVPYQGFSNNGLFWAKGVMIGAFLLGPVILLLVFSTLWLADILSWPGLLAHHPKVARQAELLTQNTQSSAQNPAFSPVLEHVLPMDKDGLTPLFDLDHDKLVPPPGPGDTSAGLALLFSSGLVVSHDEAKGQTMLMGMAAGTVTQAIPAEQWETMGAVEAIAAIDKNPGKSGVGVMTAAVATDKSPQTFLFKTPSGKMGLWQVEEFTGNPRGVKIRYKLVQRSNSTDTGSALPSVTGAQLMITSWWVETPSDFVPTLENMERDQVAKMAGVNLLTAPQMTTHSGIEAEIDIISNDKRATNTASLPPSLISPPPGFTLRILSKIEGDRVHFTLKVISTQSPTDNHTNTQQVVMSDSVAFNKLVIFDLGRTDTGRRRMGAIRFTKIENK